MQEQIQADTRPRAIPDTVFRLSSGAIGGVVSVVVFAGVHHLLISNIWETVVIMAIAGALAGVSLAWSYRRLPGRPSASRWLRYNAAYVGMFAVLPVISIALFDPVMTFVEAANSDGPLDGLIVKPEPRYAAPFL